MSYIFLSTVKEPILKGQSGIYWDYRKNTGLPKHVTPNFIYFDEKIDWTGTKRTKFPVFGRFDTNKLRVYYFQKSGLLKHQWKWNDTWNQS